MKQVWMSAVFLVCVGTAAAFADDSMTASAGGSADRASEQVAAPRAGRDAFRVAFDACLSENNLSLPQPGVRPSDADRAVMDACMKSKGINHPPGPPPDRQAASDQGAAQ